MFQMIAAPLAISLTLMTFVFFLAQLKRDNSIVDIAWGLGFIIIALFTFFTFGSFLERQVLITLLTVLWGLRLSIYILIRNKGRGEDYRYKEMRKSWGASASLQAFFKVFMLQGLLMTVIAFPIITVNYSYALELTIFDYFGLGLWCFGFVMESIADYQKHVFKSAPANKGKVLTTGLWEYSRHPNYFGESMMWWGMYFIAVSTPLGPVTVVSPLLITFLLMYVSGVPLLEKRYKNNAEYQKYAKKTPKFVPRISRK